VSTGFARSLMLSNILSNSGDTCDLSIDICTDLALSRTLPIRLLVEGDTISSRVGMLSPWYSDIKIVVWSTDVVRLAADDFSVLVVL